MTATLAALVIGFGCGVIAVIGIASWHEARR
jgi:hypothetical protein